MQYFLASLLIILLSSPVDAQVLDPKEKGMNILVVEDAKEDIPDTAQATDKEKTTVETDINSLKTDHPFNLSSTEPLSPEKSLIPLKYLKDWPYLNEIKSGSDTRVQKALDAVEADLGKVPPTALFYAAQAYLERDQKEKAAILYYMAQLRARFDFQRFPVLGNGIEKPQNNMTALSLLVGEKISPWVLSNPKRMSRIFDLVEETDLAVPYDYLPSFKIPAKTAPEETWPELLKQARDDYFTKTHELRKALSSVKR